MAKLKATKRAFKQWLDENPDLKFTRNDVCQCPLAIFLGAGCDRVVEVEHDSTSIDGETFDNPLWARRFTTAVDLFEGDILARDAAALLTS